MTLGDLYTDTVVRPEDTTAEDARHRDAVWAGTAVWSEVAWQRWVRARHPKCIAVQEAMTDETDA